VFPELSFAVTVLGVKLVPASTCWFVRGVTSNLNTPGVGGVTGGVGGVTGGTGGVGGVTGGTGGVGGVTGGTGVEGVEGIYGVDETDAQIIFKTIASGAESAIQSFA
jgi:putative lipoprotein